MGNLKIRVAQIKSKEATINSDWETRELNSTLHSYLSDTIDGVVINKILIISMSPALSIENVGVPLNVGDEILMDDMNNGLIRILFDHSYSSGVLEYKAIGATSFDIKLTINSIV